MDRSYFGFDSFSTVAFCAQLPYSAYNLTTTSNANVSSLEDISKPEYLPTTTYYWINSTENFSASQWCQM